MTTGTVWKHIVLFALPLLAGNIFQQLYNTVDSIIVGNFVGKEALAAVGSVNPVIFSLIGFFSGFSTGASAIISQYYGAKEHKNASRTVQTTILLSFILCAVLSVAGVLLTRPLLRLMSTPDDVMESAALYLTIYFAGMSGLLLYNMAAGVLRAVGDSRHPLYFLVVSALLNIALDLLFVVVFHMGVAGVAWATIIAQAVSATLELLLLSRTDGCHRILWKELRIEGVLLREIIRVGLPSAIQMTVTAFSNVFVQAYINAFGSDVMAAWSAYMKLDAFMMLPMMSLSLSTTTFVGQNLGAGNIKRARQGTHVSFAMSEMLTIFLMVPLLVFAPFLVGMFNSDPQVVSYGVYLLRLMSPFYVLCCVNQVYSGALRGAGDTRATMIIMLSSFVVFRQIYLFIVSRVFGTLMVVSLGYPAGWLLCSLITLLYYRFGKWHTRTVTSSRLEAEE